ncbi:MAG: acyl-CoA dehydrogenase [Myxococcota bacterium]
MDFTLSEDQKMLADTVQSFAKQSSPVERFRELRNDDTGWDKAVWKQMGELGWLSVPFPESVGGFGGTFFDVGLVLEKLATTLVPEPYLPSVVLGGLSILHAGNEEQQARYLTPMIEGKTSLALAHAERQSRYDPRRCATEAIANGDGFVLRGEKVYVLNGHAADHIVVSAKTSDGVSLFVVDRGAENLSIETLKTVDGHRAGAIALDGVRVESAARLGGADGADVLERVLDYGAAAVCAEGVGIAQTMLDMTTAYLKEREQFGVAIGTFQALQHRTVDMFIETELCRSMMFLALVGAEQSDPADRRRDVSAAKVQLATGGGFVAREGIQLHGGIGITDEHDIGLYFKRMTAINALFGDEEHHVERFANLPGFSLEH